MKARLPYKMTAEQKKAMNEEINRQIIENDTKFSIDHDATVLYTLYVTFGFGPKRLRRFWDACLKNIIELREYYQFGPEDDGWICRRKLKDIGVDVEAWYKENDLEGRK